jgi:hypothetical protein
MIEGEVIAKMGASAVGVAQTYLVREFVDKKSTYPLVNFLGKYGTASCLAGVGLGTIATAAGLIGMTTRHLSNDSFVNEMLVSYGVPALTSGILSGYTTPVKIVTGISTQSYVKQKQSQPQRRVAPVVASPQAVFQNSPQPKVVPKNQEDYAARVRRGIL